MGIETAEDEDEKPEQKEQKREAWDKAMTTLRTGGFESSRVDYLNEHYAPSESTPHGRGGADAGGATEAEAGAGGLVGNHAQGPGD